MSRLSPRRKPPIMIAGESARCGKTSAKMDIAFSFQKTTLKCWFSEKIDYSTTVSYRHHPYRTDWTKAAVIMGPCNLKWYKGYSVLLRQRVRMSAWSCSMSDFGQRRLLSESLCSSARATKIHTSKIRGNFAYLPFLQTQRRHGPSQAARSKRGLICHHQESDTSILARVGSAELSRARFSSAPAPAGTCKMS